MKCWRKSTTNAIWVKAMNLAEAKAECQRWLAYLERQKAKSIAMQQIAADHRNGTCSEEEGKRRVRALDSGVTVYDGGNLSEAVKFLLKRVD